MNRHATVAISNYVKLHEDCINSSTPFGQIAIEYEIESVSVSLGPVLMKAVAEVCGEDVLNMLSFVQEHVEVDVGHTAFNQRKIAEFLQDHPDALDVLIEHGKSAIDYYLGFLDDSFELAKTLTPKAA